MLKSEIYEKEFELHLRDVDKNNKMRLSSYLNLMQEIGGLHSSEFGYSLKDEPITHKAWVVLTWKLEIFKRPTWNEKIKVKSWVGKIDKIYQYRDYEMLDSNNEIVAKGVAQWIMVDTLTKKIQKVDEKILNEFPIVNREDYDNNIKKISTKVNSDNLNQIYEYKIEKRDVDTNNHMNNIVYLDLSLEGLDDEFTNNISYIEIHYKTECKYGENIVFFNEVVDDKNKVYVLDKNKEKLHTLIILK